MSVSNNNSLRGPLFSDNGSNQRTGENLLANIISENSINANNSNINEPLIINPSKIPVGNSQSVGDIFQEVIVPVQDVDLPQAIPVQAIPVQAIPVQAPFSNIISKLHPLKIIIGLILVGGIMTALTMTGILPFVVGLLLTTVTISFLVAGVFSLCGIGIYEYGLITLWNNFTDAFRRAVQIDNSLLENSQAVQTESVLQAVAIPSQIHSLEAQH